MQFMPCGVMYWMQVMVLSQSRASEIVETSYGLKAACRQPLGCGHVTQENRLCLQMSNMGMLIGHMNF